MYATTRFLSMWMWCFIYGMLMFVFIPANDITIGIRFMTDKKSTDFRFGKQRIFVWKNEN